MNGTNALMESLQTDLMLRASNVNRLIGRSKSGNAFLFREEIASSPPIITFNHHPGIRKQGKGDSQESSTYPHPHSHNPHPRKQGMWAGWAELMCVRECVLFVRKRSPLKKKSTRPSKFLHPDLKVYKSWLLLSDPPSPLLSPMWRSRLCSRSLTAFFNSVFDYFCLSHGRVLR